jgi:alkylation response protein AidB-like acyl-CoA dehydrogenase
LPGWASRIEERSSTFGLGRAAFEETLKCTQERVSGGKPIIQHQAVGLFLADMAANLEAARRLIWTVAWVKDHPEAIADGSVEQLPYELMALAFTGTAVQRLTEQGMELFGGMGVISGHADREVCSRCADTETHLVPVSNAIQDYRSAGGLQTAPCPLCGRQLRLVEIHRMARVQSTAPRR